MDIRFTIPRPPQAKGRHRSTVTKAGKLRTYTDEKTESFEAVVSFYATRAVPSALLAEPVRVDILAALPRPKRLPKTGERAGLAWAPVRPDRDNLDKAVLDGLKAIWSDDALVCAGEVLKTYAEHGGRPRVVVRIRTLGDAETPTAAARRLGLIDEAPDGAEAA